jgi:hypothetical protein
MVMDAASARSLNLYPAMLLHLGTQVHNGAFRIFRIDTDSPAWRCSDSSSIARTLTFGQTGVVAFCSIANALPCDAGLYVVVERL